MTTSMLRTDFSRDRPSVFARESGVFGAALLAYRVAPAHSGHGLPYDSECNVRPVGGNASQRVGVICTANAERFCPIAKHCFKITRGDFCMLHLFFFAVVYDYHPANAAAFAAEDRCCAVPRGAPGM